jgi:lysophospholipase L1-like esterase
VTLFRRSIILGAVSGLLTGAVAAAGPASADVGNRSAAADLRSPSATTDVGYRSAAADFGSPSATTGVGYRSAAAHFGSSSAAADIGAGATGSDVGAGATGSDADADATTGDAGAGTAAGNAVANGAVGDVVPPPPLRVMPLGDSITMGIGSQTTSSYRINLQKRLQAAGMAVDFVGSQRDGSPATADLDHEGHSGWDIARIAERVDGWVAAARPDAVLLQIGTNDMRTEAGSVGATARLSALVDRILADAPAAELFVAEITGTRTGNAAPQQRRTNKYNAVIPSLLAGKGPRVHLVDQSSVRSLDIRDGLHPNDFGYLKVAWNWFTAMEKVYNHSGSPWRALANPYLAQRAYLCHLTDADPGPKWVPFYDCRWWLRRTGTESYRAHVPAHYVNHVLVRAYTVSRTRKVIRWVSTPRS